MQIGQDVVNKQMSIPTFLTKSKKIILRGQSTHATHCPEKFHMAIQKALLAKEMRLLF